MPPEPPGEDDGVLYRPSFLSSMRGSRKIKSEPEFLRGVSGGRKGNAASAKKVEKNELLDLDALCRRKCRKPGTDKKNFGGAKIECPTGENARKRK